jgi:6-methylsalicylate decarboxylase
MSLMAYLTDVHQHLWSDPLVEALSSRSELPFIHRDRGVHVLHVAGEPPCVIDVAAETPARRAELVERDGLDRALLCLSCPLGVEWLPEDDARDLIGAYHEGALDAGEPFEVWAALPLSRPDAADVDRALERGCIGVALPAGALGSREALERLRPVLMRLEERGAPVLVHAGPGGRRDLRGPEPSLSAPIWWPALTSYVASMQAAWLAFATAGRREHPLLRVIFTMLAGLAPLHAERLASRGGPCPGLGDPLVFYDTASYGPAAVRSVAAAVGSGQILYGSDRPVVEPQALGMPAALELDTLAEATQRALSPAAVEVGLA